MDDLLKFLLTSGDQFTSGGILAAMFVFTVVALYREWIVMGGPYRKCLARVEEFERRATEKAAANEAKIAQLEAKIEELTARERRRS